MTVRVLLADDHPVFREGLRAVVEADGTCVLVGEAADGLEAVALAAELRPDVVLMDLHMPGLNGVEATARLREADPSMAVVVLTMLDEPASVSAALRAGARGYLLKGASPREVRSAVHAAAAGQSVLAAEIAAAVLRADGTSRSPGRFGDLAQRERQVVELVAAGRDNATIASTLFLSQKTVRNYVSAVMTKVGCATRAELIVAARDAGLGRSSGGA